jgi:hypothetical protein
MVVASFLIYLTLVSGGREALMLRMKSMTKSELKRRTETEETSKVNLF